MSYYTYIHRFTDTGKVFYVGMSKNRSRMNSKQRNHQPHWYAAIENREWFAELVAEWETKEEAESHEQLLIDCFKDMNHPLVNITKGGSGVPGLRWSASMRSKLLPTQGLRGKIGGSSTSLAKQKSSRANGKLGGRPKKLSA